MFQLTTRKHSSAMETGDHLKNGARPKSHTSRGSFLKTCFALLAVSVIVISINACNNANAKPSDVSAQAVRWEYKLEYTGRGIEEKHLDNLNSLGAEGWEIVGFTGQSYTYYFVLKRRLP